MKSILCLILAALTWGECVEAYWKMMMAGRYDEAMAKVESFLDEGKRVTEEERSEGEILVQKAMVCHEMKQRMQKVTLVDSLKVTRDKMLNVCEMVMGENRMKMRDDGGAEFVTTRGDKHIMSMKGQNGYDIYRQYGDGEAERLSDVVNTNVNDNFPYELTDGVTLYFASEGHGSIGGYDLFVTRYNSETFDYSTPSNVGMPFNSLGNEYLMMVDDMTGLGLWVTDWRQTGDTVMVFVYRINEGKEQTTVKKQPLPVETEVADVAESTEEIRFFITDRIIYTRLEDFRNAEAREKYVEMKELEREMRIVELVLDSKRMNFRTEMSENERKSLSDGIVEDEKYLSETKTIIERMTKEIRQLELKRYE